jgi:hypothetical protein
MAHSPHRYLANTITVWLRRMTNFTAIRHEILGVTGEKREEKFLKMDNFI